MTSAPETASVGTFGPTWAQGGHRFSVSLSAFGKLVDAGPLRGDIGDFVKLAILRALMPGERLGVAWRLYPDEAHNADGRHIGYLSSPGQWRAYDPDLFDGLAAVVAEGRRRVRALQDAGLLPGAEFCDEVIPTSGTPAKRRAGRAAWFGRVQARLAGCSIVFADPDNGPETAGFSPGALVGCKCISLAEVAALAAPGRTLVIYHHQTRRKGGHVAELAHWADRLRAQGFPTVDAIRSRPFSARAFFIPQPGAGERLGLPAITGPGSASRTGAPSFFLAEARLPGNLPIPGHRLQSQ